MESGNSGSMSSSGEEEYDLRTESIPTFLNTSMVFGGLAAANSDQAPTFLSTDPIGSSYLFGAPSSFASFLHMSPHPNPAAENPFLGFDLLRSAAPGAGRSSFNFDEIPGVASSSGQNNNDVLAPCSLSSGQSPLSQGPPPSQRDQNNSTIPVRNPKKRTRASRRAPTTVLTTDTTNFRAMVQEFTGIPAPPFSGSSFSRRLDLFGTGSGLRSGLDSLYPIRPSAQKIQLQPRPPSSSQLNSSSSPQNVAVLNIPNPVLTFQSLMSQSQGNMAMPSPLEGLQSHHRHVSTDDHVSNEKYVNSNSSQRVGNLAEL